MTDKKRERGDWQTPLTFAKKCCVIIAELFSFRPDYIIEPTCGKGNFIAAAKEVFPGVPILGMEIDESYIGVLEETFGDDGDIEIIQGDYLHEDKTKAITRGNATLVLGNPPWVTISTLSALGSNNLPEKRNVKKLRGIDAITGQSNFDISEWIIEKALSTFNGSDDMLAMLCKTSVARNVCKELANQHADVECTMMHFDSSKIFGISAAACLFVCDFRRMQFAIRGCELDDPSNIVNLVIQDGEIRQELPEALKELQGTSTLQWRQGVKHDCGRVMELNIDGDSITNKLGESVEIESEYVFPLVKSSKSRRYVIDDAEMAIPMTQHILGEETAHLKDDAPLLWNYLQSHKELFDARKSSIYKNAPDFALFGVGDYAYAPYKVSVSGFYKEPVFAFVKGDKPIMFDDTCYFIPFYSESDAKVCMLLLNSKAVKDYFSHIAFLDSKRPYSKKVLSQINLGKALKLVGIDGLNKTAEQLGVGFKISEKEYQEFDALVSSTLF